jgi:hypothetical protein
MEELFVPYTEGQRYLERESKTLADLYSGYLSVFARYHVSLDLFPPNAIDHLYPGTGREIE